MHPGAKVAGRYAIESVVTSHGMGTIYKARDPQGNLVAIKSLHRDSHGKRERFSREMRTLQDLEHPAIVRYLDSGHSADGTPYFVMEWLDGEDLSSRVRAGPLSLGETLTWAGRIAEALGVAHGRGIVHRDVKPSNIFLPGGSVVAAKLIDFGIALVAGANSHLTATGVMMGTPAYMAPEQARGEREIDMRADVFALGCVIYESLTGVAPFVANTPMAVLGKILVEPSPRLRDTIPEIHAACDELLGRMMAKSRDERPGSGAEVAAELERIAAALDDEPHLLLHQRHERASVLTREERRWVSAVVVAAEMGIVARDPQLTAPTVQLDAGHRPTPPPASLLKLGGASFLQLGDGSLVNIVEVRGAATDQAQSAAQIAMILRREFPDRQVAVATGRALMRSGRMAGDVIDRAADILRSVQDPNLSLPAPAGVWVDELTAELLDGRFEVFQQGHGLMLSGRRRTFEERTLLGRSTPFVGRRREFSALVATVEECVEESVAHAVLVTGPPGFGKSRLLHELLGHLDDYSEDVEIWLSQGDPMHEGSSLFSMADAIRRTLDVDDSAPVELRRAALHARIQQTVGSNTSPGAPPDASHNASHDASHDVERMYEFIAELLGLATERPSLSLRAARKDPRLMGDQIQRACADFITARCARNPLLLVIDDLQWSDRATVAVLDRTLRNLAEQPFMVIAFGRPETHERFPRIWAERSITELRLGPLTRRAAEKLARSMLGRHTDDELIKALVARAGGNAFYLEELLRSAAMGHSEWPESVLAMVEMRLESLEVQARQTLRAASVFGSVFWRGGVHALLGSDDIDDWLERLVERELLTESRSSQFAGEREYRFRHALVREGAYAMLTDADRKLGHQLAAEWLESVGEPDPRVIAEQFERGDVHTRALPYFVRAAKEAFEVSDLDVALTLAERAVSCGAEGPMLGELCRLCGTIRIWQARSSEAAELFTQAMELLPRGSREWYDAAGEAAGQWSKVGDRRAVERVAVALRADDNPTEPLEDDDQTDEVRSGRFIALIQLARAMFDVDQRDRAARLLDDIRSAIGPEPDDPLLGANLHYANVRYYIEVVGDPVRSLQELESVLVHFEVLGDTRQACIQRANIGYIKMELGLYREAEQVLRRAMETATRLGQDETVHNARRLLALAVVRNWPNKVADALQLARTAETWFVAHGNQVNAAWTQVIMAGMCLAEGDLDGAETLARLAAEIVYTRVAATATLSRVLLARGDNAQALAAAERALVLHHEPGSSEEDRALVELVHAEALRASGHIERAAQVIGEAHRALHERAQKIGHADWRKCFLTAIPDHARIGELNRAWNG